MNLGKKTKTTKVQIFLLWKFLGAIEKDLKIYNLWFYKYTKSARTAPKQRSEERRVGKECA